MPHLPPEARLVLLAARPRSPADDAALAGLVRQPLNWAVVSLLAERERLVPVVWNRLREHFAALPPAAADVFRKQAGVTEFRMILTEAVLERVLRELAGEGVDAMLLKGAALAVTAYRSFASRPMGDLDLLVPSGDAQRAWQRLRASGWTVHIEGAEEFYDHHHHLPRLIDPGGVHVELEVHRLLMHPLSPFVLADAEVWRDACSAKVGSTHVVVPSDAHQLLHLSVHFAWSHMLSFGVARTARDVTMLLGRGTLDWPAFVEIAQRVRAGTCAYWTLAISRTLGGADVPGDVLEALRPRQPLFLTRALERAYVMSGLVGSCPSVEMDRLLWSAGVRPRASGHGSARPWNVEEAFEAIAAPRPPSPIGQRVSTHLRDTARWLRFAKVLSIPRPIV